MKIYTGTGDRGQSGLFSGERVPKDHPRLEAYGDLDELTSVLGALASALPEDGPDRIEELAAIQSNLLLLGSWLATTPDSPVRDDLPDWSQLATPSLEQAIDAMEEHLEPLRSFLLPGGHPGSGWAHLARTICRRVERRLVSLLTVEDDQPVRDALVYVNRLSDYLFVLARDCNRLAGIPDRPWQP